MENNPRRAQKYAIARGFGFIADDFSSFVSEQELKGRLTSLKFHLGDYLRMNQWIFQELSCHTDYLHHEYGPAFQYAVTNLKGTDRAFVILLYYWGLTQNELAFVFGLTEGRISQLLERIKKDAVPLV